jgi:hypothetical protein
VAASVAAARVAAIVFFIVVSPNSSFGAALCDDHSCCKRRACETLRAKRIGAAKPISAAKPRPAPCLNNVDRFVCRPAHRPQKRNPVLG